MLVNVFISDFSENWGRMLIKFVDFIKSKVFELIDKIKGKSLFLVGGNDV